MTGCARARAPAAAAEGGIRFAGYAAVFDRVDRGGDVVRPGAFAASLAARRTVPLLWQHRPGAVIGAIEALAEDARGLRVVARVTHPTAAALVARGALTGLSFGYRVIAARGTNPRELLGLDLAEVSLVAAPMQALARVIAVEREAPCAGGVGRWQPAGLTEGRLAQGCGPSTTASRRSPSPWLRHGEDIGFQKE